MQCPRQNLSIIGISHLEYGFTIAVFQKLWHLPVGVKGLRHGKMRDGEHLVLPDANESTHSTLVYSTHSCYRGQFLGKLWC